MPSARYSISRLARMSVVGAKPLSTAPQLGSAIAICTAKHAAITPSIATTKASIQRKPNACSARIRNTSAAVMITPISSGMWNSRLRPIAVPITSARSVAVMAISADSHSGNDTQRGKESRHAWARSRPEPTPSRVHSDCSTIAMTLDSSATVQQPVAEFGAAGERGRPVAGIHIADGHQVTRAEERQQLAPEWPLLRRPHRAEHIRQRRFTPCRAPAGAIQRGAVSDFWQGIGGKSGDRASMATQYGRRHLLQLICICIWISPSGRPLTSAIAGGFGASSGA